MGLRQKLKQIFGIGAKDKALQSDLKRFKALESASNLIPEDSSESAEVSRPLELQKDSLQLGIAAGYTGKFIREIERSLGRIESQMVSKDWFTSSFEDRTPELIEVLDNIKTVIHEHDSNVSQRFKALESALNRIQSIAAKSPEPIKQELMKEVEIISSTLPLTSKMKELVSAVKETGKLSYDDLCTKLNITRSSLRGLLANTMKRTNEIERFSVGGKGWVRYKTTENN
jgi:type I site-specific restriction endonuclease